MNSPTATVLDPVLRSRLVRVLLLLLCIVPLAAAAQTPFATNIVPTLTFTDSHLEVPLEIPDDPGVFDLYEKGDATVLAELSMAGVDLATIDAETIFALQLGYIELSLPLSSDPTYTAGKTSASLPVIGTNPDTLAPTRVGTVNLTWNSERLTVSIAITDFNADFQIAAVDEAYTEGNINDETSVTLQFAGRILQERVVYYQGTGSIYAVTVGKGENRERYTDLAKVDVSGGIDSTLPTVSISEPGSGVGSTLSPSITVSGKAGDNRGLFKVLVQVNGGAFTEAVLQPSGDWSLAGVPLQQGENTVVAKVVDLGGNEQLSEPRWIRYVILTQLSFNGAGTGSGRITSRSFTLSYEPDDLATTYEDTVEVGSLFTVTAKPAAGELFSGWTSNFPLSPAQAASPDLIFTVQENQTITATFTANPFAVAGAVGRYTALVQSDDAADRGTLTGVLTKTGAFSGTIRVGKLTLPLKTQFNAQGQLDAPVTIQKNGRTYTLTLDLDLTENGARLLTGTISGGGVTGTVTGERTQFAKKGPKSPHTGSYTLLFVRNEDANTDDYPFGVGYARAKVSKRGAVKFVGRLGDGTAVSSSSYIAATGFWPFFAQAYGNGGSISGVLQFDLQAESIQVTGSLDWVKPARASDTLYPQGFSGVSDVIGTRAGAQPAGARMLVLNAPELVAAGLPALAVELPASFDGSSVTITAPALQLQLRYTAETGLFRGSFVEETPAGPQTRKFSGAFLGPTTQVAGGYFVRGNTTGSASLLPE
ncbi:MAG TPA: hypothetical protein VF614_15730 [Chthoniobacteraceae bacterium]|jgi:hypothetical protein